MRSKITFSKSVLIYTMLQKPKTKKKFARKNRRQLQHKKWLKTLSKTCQIFKKYGLCLIEAKIFGLKTESLIPTETSMKTPIMPQVTMNSTLQVRNHSQSLPGENDLLVVINNTVKIRYHSDSHFTSKSTNRVIKRATLMRLPKIVSQTPKTSH